MSANSKIYLLLAGLSFSTLFPNVSSAQSVSDVAWTHETRGGSCTTLIFDMPASLVPIYSAGTPSAVGEWQSFDQKFMFLYEDNSIHLGYPSMSKKEYLGTVKCAAADFPQELCVSAARFGATLSRSDEKEDYEGVSTKGRECINIDAIAPAKNDESRFGTRIQFCGPSSKKSFVQEIGQKVLKSLRYSYGGCCKQEPNQNGCKN